MTLSFTQTINGKPNYFIEKIWAGLTHHFPFKESGWFLDYKEMFIKQFGYEWPCTPATSGMPPEKIHTIRFDPHNRWRAGMNIHPVINNRTPKRFQFAPVIPCKSVQRIDIGDVTMLLENDYSLTHRQVKVDGKILDSFQIAELAVNEGFGNAFDFLEYFKDGVTDGKLIHWADKSY